MGRKGIGRGVEPYCEARNLTLYSAGGETVSRATQTHHSSARCVSARDRPETGLRAKRAAKREKDLRVQQTTTDLYSSLILSLRTFLQILGRSIPDTLGNK